VQPTANAEAARRSPDRRGTARAGGDGCGGICSSEAI
jgi:hypothetical protein